MRSAAQRNSCAVLAVLLAAGAGGCIPSKPLAEGELDRYWRVRPDVWPLARREKVTMSGRAVPTRWLIRQEPSIIWSTVSIVRASDRLETGADEIEFSVSPAHTDQLGRTLADAREVLLGLRRLQARRAASDVLRWSEAVANALTRGEQIVRTSTIEPSDRAADAAAERGALAAGPLMQMVTLYISRQTNGGILADLRAEEVGHLREVLARALLRLGFALAGREVPEGLRDAVVRQMRETKDLVALAGDLRRLLAEKVGQASPAPSGSELQALVGRLLSWGPKVIEILETILRQWDRFESLEMEYRSLAGRPIVALTVRVRPGRVVRLADLFVGQPTLLCRGACRIVVDASAAPTGETVVSFQPIQDGAVEIRFEGMVHGLVRLLAIPLADSRLREIRVAAANGGASRMINITVLMTALGEKADPRRMLVFQDVRDTRIVRTAFAVGSRDRRVEQTFNYLTPGRRYTYHRRREPGSR